MSASFDEKVDALRRLQERRQARLEKEAQKENSPAKASGYPTDEATKDELPAVLEHYSGLQAAPATTDTAADAGPDGNVGSEAESDEADALYCLGHCFEQGLHDCGQDLEKAKTYYRMAAEKGSVLAQWRLGHLHEYGQGLERSDAMAADWYRLAAEGGHPHAQSSLALLLDDGRATALSDGEALHWHREAAAQGNALSQYCVACVLAEGRGGTNNDSEEAVTSLLEKSAASGFPMAKEALAQGRSWIDSRKVNDAADPISYAEEGDRGSSLLDIAARVAKQIEHLPDGDVEAYLEQLMGSLDDPELQDMLGGSDLDAIDVCN